MALVDIYARYAMGDFAYIPYPIAKRGPILNYDATLDEIVFLLTTFPQVWIYDSQSKRVINLNNLKEYYPEYNPGNSGCGYTKEEIDALFNKKVDKIDGKQLSSEDFTFEMKQKLDKCKTIWIGTQTEYESLLNTDDYEIYIVENGDGTHDIYYELKEIYGSLPIIFNGSGKALIDYRIYGNLLDGKNVGDQDPNDDTKYHIPVTITNGSSTRTVDIIIPSVLKDGEYIDYSEKCIYRYHDDELTPETITLPELPTFSGINTLTIGSSVIPKCMIIKGKIINAKETILMTKDGLIRIDKDGYTLLSSS